MKGVKNSKAKGGGSLHLLENIIPLPKGTSKSRKYEQEVKSAIGEKKKKITKKKVVEKEDKPKNPVKKLDNSYALKLHVGKYSYDKKKAKDVIEGLRRLYARRGREKVLGKL